MTDDPKITELDEEPPDADDAPEPKNDVVPAPTSDEEDQP